MQKCLISFILREMQTKASFRLHHTLVRLAIIRNVNKGLRRHLSREELLLFFQIPTFLSQHPFGVAHIGL